MSSTEQELTRAGLPDWVPAGVRRYLFHTEAGRSIRELARLGDCHASTVLRQVRRTEALRDDPLIDDALKQLSLRMARQRRRHVNGDSDEMQALRGKDFNNNDAEFRKEAMRVLRRLAETGAVLAVAEGMEKAVVVRDSAGTSQRTAVADREIVHAMALNDWISVSQPGRISRYTITSAGRSALKRMLSEAGVPGGMAEAQTPFGDQHRVWGEKDVAEEGERPRRMRYNVAESPLTGLARRKDKDGKPFLSDELVAAGERLREDFELAQMGPRVAQNWDRFLTAGDRGSFSGKDGFGRGAAGARDRVAAALNDLGPGLGDMVLRCCCYLEGLEVAEKRMGWSARSGKIVLRIALQRLKRHYDETHGPHGPLIG